MHRPANISHSTDAEAIMVSTTIATDTEDAIEAAQQTNDAQQPVAEIDLLQRIRQGFRLPSIDSKTVKKQEHWNATHKTFLNNLFNRATPFLFHIVDEIEKRGLPMELALLPAIESSFKPNAISHSGAGGLWQFIPATGVEYGLRQDWWYDGRRDALASTTAALDYLTRLNKRYDGDWFLALAAYNAGPGTVSRAIRANKKKGKGTRYQDLKLRLETRRYVPKLIALTNIIKNPQKYGVELPIILNKPHFKVVRLKGQTDLQKFAHDAGIERAELNHLNAGFMRWATSPKGPHHLLIPVNANGDVNHAEIAVKRAKNIAFQHHRIAQGDTLSGIARQYGVTTSSLKTSNHLMNSRILAGKNLIIPVKSTVAAATKELNASKSDNIPSIHTVRKGDTLWSISRNYNINLNNLLAMNNLTKNHVLNLNQLIKLVQN